jgi:hypothetical protein
VIGWSVILAVIYLSIKSDARVWRSPWTVAPAKPTASRVIVRPTTAPDLEFERTHPRPPLRPRTSPVRALVPVPPALASAPSMVLSVARAPQPPPPVSGPVAVQDRIAATPSPAKAPVVVTVSTQIRLSALAALRRLGFSQKDAQAQLDTSLGLAIQQSLLKG